MSSKILLLISGLAALVIFGELAWGGGQADKNNAIEDAVQIEFGSTTDEWLGDADHIDYYRFVVSTPEVQGKGKITLTAVPGELVLYLYDATNTELFKGKTTLGELTYEFTSDVDFLRGGAYYIAVFLPKARNDENSYSLELTEGGAPVFTVLPIAGQAQPIDLGALV